MHREATRLHEGGVEHLEGLQLPQDRFTTELGILEGQRRAPVKQAVSWFLLHICEQLGIK